jgi:hypothetical protein
MFSGLRAGHIANRVPWVAQVFKQVSKNWALKYDNEHEAEDDSYLGNLNVSSKELCKINKNSPGVKNELWNNNKKR